MATNDGRSLNMAAICKYGTKNGVRKVYIGH